MPAALSQPIPAPDQPEADGEHRAAIRRIASHFPWRNHWHRNYSRTKLRTDPVYRAVYEELRQHPEMPLTDLGCGLGLNGMYLRQRGWRGDYLGIDFDPRKIRLGQKIMARHYDAQCRVETGDLRDFRLARRGHVTLLDILQYFDADQQQRLLETVAASMPPGARLLIRATLKDDSWRFRINRWCDWFARCVLWMKSPPVNYTTREELTTRLKGLGFEGEFRPLWGGTPFCNWFGSFARAPKA